MIGQIDHGKEYLMAIDMNLSTSSQVILTSGAEETSRRRRQTILGHRAKRVHRATGHQGLHQKGKEEASSKKGRCRVVETFDTHSYARYASYASRHLRDVGLVWGFSAGRPTSNTQVR